MALVAAYMEEVKLWLGRLADDTVEGYKQIGDVLFYKSTLPAVIPEGMTAINVSTAHIEDFVGAYDLSLFNPLLIGGIFIGAMMAFLFSSMSMKAVGRAAGSMVDEVRRQFREIPGIMEGTGKPDYARCVAISTKGAQREMMLPSLIAIAVPLIIGLTLGVAGVVGLLIGGMTTGFTLASMLNNSGGAWDNAKKFIEKGNYGGKGSESHKAGVVGDTVGDPFKDTSGPSLNILIKLMSMVSVVMAGLTGTWSIMG
jgi:K(+)-stimulated pyrophosphate-energized sodium pump